MGIQDLTLKMSWFTRRKSSKPSQTNLIKPLLKCLVINITAKYDQLCPHPASGPCSLCIFYTINIIKKCFFHWNQHKMLPNKFIYWTRLYLLKFYQKVPTNVNTNVQLTRLKHQRQGPIYFAFLKFFKNIFFNQICSHFSVVRTCLRLFIHNNLYRSYVCHRIWLLKF